MQVPDHVLVRPVGGEGLVLDLDHRRYYALNATAWLVVSMLADGATADDVAQRLANHFSIDRGRARTDVDALIAALVERGILHAGP